jgi:hypothetical protein
MKHELIRSVRPRGGGSKGTNASCTCKQWSMFTNDHTPSRAARTRWAEKDHAAHAASRTVEQDIAALKDLIAYAQDLVITAVENDDVFILEGWAPKLADLHAQLAADVRKRIEQD